MARDAGEMLGNLGRDGSLELVDEYVSDLSRVVEAALGQVVQREQRLVDGGEVARHLVRG